MEKKDRPFVLKVKEAENRIVATINNSQLPAFIMKPIIEKIYNQLIELEHKEYAISLEEERKNAIEKENTKKDKKK